MTCPISFLLSISDSQKTWCRFEGSTPSVKNVHVLPADKCPPSPKLIVASIKVQVVLNTMHKKNEVVAVACVLHDAGVRCPVLSYCFLLFLPAVFCLTSFLVMFCTSQVPLLCCGQEHNAIVMGSGA